MTRWMCRGCGHINQLEDGPVCENCLADNDHATEEILDAWDRASRVTTSEALCRAEALRTPKGDWWDAWKPPVFLEPPPIPDELWRDFRRTEAADARAMPCPSCGAILTWEFLVSVDGFRCGPCGYVIYGVEAAAWHARNDPPRRRDV